ncbi:MAG: acyl-ACP--UDP-N-acetylglucosamine O-acyltransferase [Verrucomicrobiaceae bacterium]|nr:acyl-ACP--UDP-N-acetylglucosamine O-acyltransferase [Verrucomicrobiaceae bacterium]
MTVALTNIHPTAVIDAGASLGNDVIVGPYCIIGDGVELGSRCVLHNHVSLTGPASIGENNEFYPHCAIGGRSQDLKYEAEPTYLNIGSGNTFREFVTVNRGTSQGDSTSIGNDGHFLAYSHVAHDCVVGNGVIFSNNGTLAGHVTVEDNAILGGLSAIHQFCRVGRHAITGGCSKIVQDVPPFMIADGNPAQVRGVNTVGLQRHGFSEDQIRALKQAYKVIFKRNLTLDEALAELKGLYSGEGVECPVNELIAFVEASQRGIIR